jgi:two-component system response regulator FixJ
MKPSIYVLDDDPDVVSSLAQFLTNEGFSTRQFTSGVELLAAYRSGDASCIISDIRVGKQNGFEVAREIRNGDPAVSLIFMTAWPCTQDAVDAVKLEDGVDYLEKPLDLERLVAAVREAIERTEARRARVAKLECLTRRELEVLDLIAQGHTTKSVAKELGLSPRTIEDHRANIFSKTKASTLAELFVLAGHGARSHSRRGSSKSQARGT